MTGVVVDTSVAVPLVLASHRQHVAVNEYLDGRAIRLVAHGLLETYSVLTRLPGDARLSAADANRLLTERFGEAILLRPATSRALVSTLSAAGIVGGAVYDALIGLTARDAGLVLATRDRRAIPTLVALNVDHEFVLAGP